MALRSSFKNAVVMDFHSASKTGSHVAKSPMTVPLTVMEGRARASAASRGLGGLLGRWLGLLGDLRAAPLAPGSLNATIHGEGCPQRASFQKAWPLQIIETIHAPCVQNRNISSFDVQRERNYPLCMPSYLLACPHAQEAYDEMSLKSEPLSGLLLVAARCAI